MSKSESKTKVEICPFCDCIGSCTCREVKTACELLMREHVGRPRLYLEAWDDAIATRQI
jgi:hypothetical protein